MWRCTTVKDFCCSLNAVSCCSSINKDCLFWVRCKHSEQTAKAERQVGNSAILWLLSHKANMKCVQMVQFWSDPELLSFFLAKNTSLVQNTSLSIHIQWNEHRCVRFLCVRWSNGQQTIMLQGLNGIHLFEWWMLIFLIINWCLVLFQWWFIAFFMRSGYSTWTEVHHVADDVLSLLSAAASCL